MRMKFSVFRKTRGFFEIARILVAVRVGDVDVGQGPLGGRHPGGLPVDLDGLSRAQANGTVHLFPETLRHRVELWVAVAVLTQLEQLRGDLDALLVRFAALVVDLDSHVRTSSRRPNGTTA
jgi:hypothetical protein